MTNVLRGCVGLGVLLLGCEGAAPHLQANPAGGTPAQGTATFTTSGSQLTITTSDRAFINWQSFNIAPGETTTFIQPSSSSLVWNQIHDANPSQILGNLNANGYVVLQNQSGFFIGGQAAINTHGLLMTTAPIQMPDLTGSSAWTFNAPAPSAKIVNYGQINIAGGGSAFLLASDIENNGIISAPGGKIGLYAGQQILVSTSPDGRGLSARVTLPEGSVDNEGHLIADAGSIAMQAQMVNQGGLVQANSARNINGTIELVAGDKITLSANSTISASGDSTAGGSSPGGFVVLNARNTFADTASSAIDVSGKSGGQDGIIEIFGSGIGAGTIQSSTSSHYALLFNPNDITLSTSATTPSSPDPNLYVSDLSRYAQIDLHANDNITLTASWILADPGAGASLRLAAGNNVAINNNASIVAANNWSVDLTAGTALATGTKPTSGHDGIYLNGNGYIQTQNGGVSLYAANEVIVSSGGVRTLKGGSITATALDGDVNTGTSTSGFNYLSKAPYYTPFSVNIFGTISANSTLGGISTAGGGDVTINAGGNVTSYLPGQSDTGDPGTGAFGSQPGNVTINGVGNVYGHYVVVNGVGLINGQNIGSTSQNVALSLVKGGWSLSAPNGNIYLQEARNPNGVFNATGSYGSGGNHLFDYDPLSYVDLTAGGVYLTGQNLPRANGGVPMLMPPTLEVSADAGGFSLQNPVALGGVGAALSQPDIILFPSAHGDLQITTSHAGKFEGNGATLLMSDSGQTHWIPSDHAPPGPKPFSDNDHAAVPAELNNSEPAKITIAGNMDKVTLKTSKATQIAVGGNMTGCSFYGQNLQPGDVTSIDVAGNISNPTSFTPFSLFQPIQNLPLADLPPDTINNWETVLSLAIDPVKLANLDLSKIPPSQYSSLVNGLLLFGNALQTSFAYDPKNLTLTFAGSMSPNVRSALDQPLNVLVYGPNGIPAVQKDPKTGEVHFKTDTFTWVASKTVQNPDGTSTTINPIDELYKNSQGVPALKDSAGGYIIGGPGVFNVRADSISLGNTYGIISLGNGRLLGADYSYLTPYVHSGGASLNVTVAGDLVMPASTIAALGGGNVNVISTGGSMDLGSQYLVQFEAEIMKDNLGLGIYTSGGGNVTVSSQGSINIDSSRIATFNGGNIFIESFGGDVNAGSGGNVSIPINVFSPLAQLPSQPFEYVYANGIVAQTLVNAGQVPNSAKFPGNITVKTPHGSIIANLGGILQEALNGNIAAGPTITLVAGSDDYKNGNVNLGDAGVIGGTVNVTASGTVSGLVITRQDSNISAAQSFVGTVLSGGTANLASGGTISGTVIGATGVNASGAGGVTAALIGQNVSVNGGASQSTLGTATATATSQSAAGQASTDAKEQVASNTAAEEDDSNKKKGKTPTLVRRSRVTVILPAKT